MVEALSQVAAELDMLALVFSYRHLVRGVEQDVRSLQDGIRQESGPDSLLIGRLGLVLGHALEPT